ncbi:hypothetical protein MTO96_010321 [Rhipicephalus appendiculatus]
MTMGATPRSRKKFREHRALGLTPPSTFSSVLVGGCMRSAQRAPSDVQESRQHRDSNDVPRSRERNLQPTLSSTSPCTNLCLRTIVYSCWRRRLIA